MSRVLRTPRWFERANSETVLSSANRNTRKCACQSAGTSRAHSGSMKRDDENDIDERSHRFFVDVLGFVDTIPAGPNTKKLIEQLAAAAGSIGGNRKEALGGSSRKEFIRFNEVSLRGANESVRWLRACAARRLGAQEQCVAFSMRAASSRESSERSSSRRNAATERGPRP
jgi:four helix bundle protein